MCAELLCPCPCYYRGSAVVQIPCEISSFSTLASWKRTTTLSSKLVQIRVLYGTYVRWEQASRKMPVLCVTTVGYVHKIYGCGKLFTRKMYYLLNVVAFFTNSFFVRKEKCTKNRYILRNLDMILIQYFLSLNYCCSLLFLSVQSN